MRNYLEAVRVVMEIIIKDKSGEKSCIRDRWKYGIDRLVSIHEGVIV